MTQPIQTFYDVFKFGMEFEMEIPRNEAFISHQNNASNDDPSLLRITTDGSVNATVHNSTTLCREIITNKPLESQKEEDTFFKTFKLLLPNFKSKTGEDIFAYYNTSAGTHYHWSFKDKPDEYLWIFDTRRFQKYFFSKYMETFKSEKFLARINNSYCKSPNLTSAKGEATKPHEIRKDLNKISLRRYNSEYAETSRYRWLNMQSVGEGTGAEIRVFPFLQTHSGVRQTTNFMKQVLLDYYAMPETQAQLKLLEKYEMFIAKGTLKTEKLSEIKQIVYEVLSEIRPISGEARILFGKWLEQQPTLIKVTKAF